MKILFVCKWNVGRSQIAEELFNKYTKKNIGITAGTHAIKFEGKRLKDFAHFVVDVLKEKSIDISNKIPVQLTKEMLQFADKVIVMTEKENLPEYLLHSDKVVYWDIKDGDGKDYKFHINMRNQIELLIKELVKQIG